MAAAATAAARRSAATAPRAAPRPKARPASRSRAGATRPARVAPSRRPARASHRSLTPAPARLVPLAVGRTAVAVRTSPTPGVIQRLTRGRLWIGLLTGLLVGIVSLNVLTLSFNASASKVGRAGRRARSGDLRPCARKITSEGASGERIATAATTLGLVAPEPGAARYLRPSPSDADGGGQAPGVGRARDRRLVRRTDPVIERRVGLLFACFLLLFCIAIGRAAWVQGVQGASLGADAQSQQVQTVTIPGLRGRILDRSGIELAVSEDAADVIATPYQVEDPAAPPVASPLSSTSRRPRSWNAR